MGSCNRCHENSGLERVCHYWDKASGERVSKPCALLFHHSDYPSALDRVLAVFGSASMSQCIQRRLQGMWVQALLHLRADIDPFVSHCGPLLWRQPGSLQAAKYKVGDFGRCARRTRIHQKWQCHGSTRCDEWRAGLNQPRHRVRPRDGNDTTSCIKHKSILLR